MSTARFTNAAPQGSALKVGDLVRLRNNVVGFGVGNQNPSARVECFLADVDGGLRLDRELRGCRYWNVLDVQRVGRHK